MTNLPDIDLGERANRFRLEVRDWLKDNNAEKIIATDDPRPVNHIRADQDFSRKLAAQGWLALDWPKAWGGQERTATERLVFDEELAYADAPVGWHNTSAGMIAPTLIHYGTDAQREKYVGAIGRGDLAFSLGYSEPANGSDLSGIRTTATRTDKGWLIRGQKIYTSTAGFAEYCWLAARTDPNNPRAGGISVFIVPLRGTPGLTKQPSVGLNGHDTYTIFYDDVLLPHDALVGEVNGGWEIITAALAYERVALGAIGARARGYFDRLVEYVNATGQMARDPALRDRLADLAAQIEGARLLAIKTAKAIEAGKVPVAEGAMVKVYSSELMERLTGEALNILGPGATLSPTVESTILKGKVEYGIRDSLLYTIGGGTNEIQRTLIALRGLGLPR